MFLDDAGLSRRRQTVCIAEWTSFRAHQDILEQKCLLQSEGIYNEAYKLTYKDWDQQLQ